MLRFKKQHYYFKFMRSSYFLFLSVALSLGLISCNNDLNIAAPWKNIPVVYGFLDKNDTAHYVIIQKAYLDPDISAYVQAKIPDSIYYKNLTVRLEQVKTKTFYTLTEVDGNKEGYVKKDGDFATSPNLLYKIKSSDINLQANETYKIHIDRNDSTPEITASTSILDESKISNPPLFSTLQWSVYSNRQNIQLSLAENVTFFSVFLRFNVLETDPANPDNFIPKQYKFQLGQNESKQATKGGFTLRFLPSEVYQTLASVMKSDPNIKRKFVDLDIILLAAGKEYDEYLTLIAANSGITASQDVPKYTNIYEDNKLVGVGLFTSKSTSINTGYRLASQSLDTLKNGIYTKSLNFID